MPFMTAEERALARAFSELNLCNPFLPERVALERQVLGSDFADIGEVWHARPAPNHANPNVITLAERPPGRPTPCAPALPTASSPAPSSTRPSCCTPSTTARDPS
jgi:hypothetical protein